MGISDLGPKPPVPSPGRIATLRNRVVTARSGFPSRLKSAGATELAPPTAKSVLGAKAPPPGDDEVFTRTETESAPLLATPRSGAPSRLRSAEATEAGPAPVAKSVLGPKPPVPLPSRTETVLASALATATSGA